MPRVKAFLAAVAVCVACSTASAIWWHSETGTWPESWPKALEPLRKQSRSIGGSLANLAIHQIPFTKRDEFEAAWPELLKVKTKGAPLILVRSPGLQWRCGETKTGVLVHYAPDGVDPYKLIGPLPGVDDLTYIELVVDGEIVDLNRIPLPADTPIIDERFKAALKADAGIEAVSEGETQVFVAGTQAPATAGPREPAAEQLKQPTRVHLKLSDGSRLRGETSDLQNLPVQSMLGPTLVPIRANSAADHCQTAPDQP